MASSLTLGLWGGTDVIAFFVVMGTLAVGVLCCLLYIAWAGVSVVAGSLQTWRTRGRTAPQPHEVLGAETAGGYVQR